MCIILGWIFCHFFFFFLIYFSFSGPFFCRLLYFCIPGQYATLILNLKWLIVHHNLSLQKKTKLRWLCAPKVGYTGVYFLSFSVYRTELKYEFNNWKVFSTVTRLAIWKILSCGTKNWIFFTSQNLVVSKLIWPFCISPDTWILMHKYIYGDIWKQFKLVFQYCRRKSNFVNLWDIECGLFGVIT